MLLRPSNIKGDCSLRHVVKCNSRVTPSSVMEKEEKENYLVMVIRPRSPLDVRYSQKENHRVMVIGL
jgi:hypothetical protein